MKIRIFEGMIALICIVASMITAYILHNEEGGTKK